MKQLLLLAAIYSLIIHQSKKQEKKDIPATRITINMAKSVNNPKRDAERTFFSYENPSFINGINNKIPLKLSIGE